MGDYHMRKIPLTQGKVAFVDNADYRHVAFFKWYAHRRGRLFYAQRHCGPYDKIVLMHRVILNVAPNEAVDHIDGNGLNNCRSNLRIATQRENCQNLHIPKTSRYPGVHKMKQIKNPWRSEIYVNGKNRHLGCFETEELAHTAYETAVASLNNQICVDGELS